MEEKITDTEGGADKGNGEHAGNLRFVRLNYNERVQHLILAVCFIILVVTGFMLNIPEDTLMVLGSAGEMIFFWRSVLHRVAGTTLILLSLYHIYYIIFNPAGRRWISDMKLGIKDLKELAGTLQYYVGLKESVPEYDRFCYKHKFEYLALFFGNTVMSVTGLLQWTEYRWSKFVLDISTLMHGMEAILASLAIIIWHLYEIHLRPHKFPHGNVCLTGVIDKDAMKEDFPLHYKKIVDDPELRKIYIKREADDE